jgi:F-type H+-transporting ATPase subunit b
MQIDLFTFIAQVVNFLVLILLLRRFLYKPILRAMEQREARITSDIREAEEKKEKAEQEAAKYRERQQELQNERESILSSAREEADGKRRELLQQAREEVDRNRSRWHGSLEEGKERFLRDLRRRAGEEMVRAMRQALRDLAGADLERQVIRTFIERLENPTGEEREVLESISGRPEDMRIVSTFDIPGEERRRILAALPGGLAEPDVEFSRPPSDREELICGIEVAADNRRLSWNLAGYLRSLEEELGRRLEAETHGR